MPSNLSKPYTVVDATSATSAENIDQMFDELYQKLTDLDISAITTGVLPVTLGGTGVAGPFTEGSVVFVGPAGVYAQDNAHFFWDDTNNRLGLGTNAPIAGLLTLYGGDSPTDNSLQILGTGDGINFKDAANSVLYGVIISGSSPDRLRISTAGAASPLVLQENLGLVTFGGTTASFPGLKRSGAKLQVRLADDSAYADLQADYLFANTASTNRPVTIGGLPADKVNFAGLWFTSAALSSTNYTFLASSTAALFNAPTSGGVELRVGNVTRFTVGPLGAMVHGADNTLPTVAFEVNNEAKTQLLLSLTNTGLLRFFGTTSSFPALKRSTTTLEVRLADDSAYAGLTVLNLFATSDITQTGGGISTHAGGYYRFTGRGYLTSPSDGVWLLRDEALTSFGRLQFGGTSNAFPALKRSAALIAVRLADDSADAGITVSTLTTSGITILGAPARLKGYTVATLPAGVQGDVAFVTDALAPAFITAVVGGGAIVTPVFYNGAAWVAG